MAVLRALLLKRQCIQGALLKRQLTWKILIRFFFLIKNVETYHYLIKFNQTNLQKILNQTLQTKGFYYFS